MNEPLLKKKGILKAQYVYNAVLLLVLLLGVSYALVTFLYNEEGTSGSLTSSLVKITVDEETSFNLDNTSPVTDEEGLQGYSKTLTLTNTSSIDSLVNVTLDPDTGNDIETSSTKYGLYINGTLKKTASLTDATIYNGLLLQGEKIRLEIYLWVDSTYTGSGSTFKGEFEVKSTEAVMTMADYVTKLVDKDKGVCKIGNDYRYSGLDVDNYIWFNCKDGTTGGANNCELWRIVGSLETKANSYANTYRRVKIVKVDNLDNQTFGDNNTFTSSSLHTYLNGDYYTSLTSQSQKMVIGSEWNVGSSVLTNTPEVSLTNEQTSKLYTKVGLLSASDIGYSTSTENQTKPLNNADLYTNSWLKGSSYYTLTPITDSTTTVIGDNATSITSLEVGTANGVKPSVYLIPNVYIKSGNGTSNSPYEVALVDEKEHYSDVKIVGYITYDVNGQSVSTPKMQAIFADGSTVINATLSDTPGARFKGWATSEDGEVVYQKGDTITETSDVTLYARWYMDAYHTMLSSTWYMDNENSEFVKNTTPGIDFSSTFSDTNGKGIYMRAGTENSIYPILYYRGSVTDNNVLYNGFCWKMVRTTDTGGVKMIYNGVPISITNEQTGETTYSCDNTGTASQLTDTKKFNGNTYSPADVGYMYGTCYASSSYNEVVLTEVRSPAKYYYGDDITYENGMYILSNATQYAWSSSTYKSVIGKYTCRSTTSSSCSSVYYVEGGRNLDGYFLKLSDGKYLDDISYNYNVGTTYTLTDGVYTLGGTITSVALKDWYTSFESNEGLYSCLSNTNSCTKLYRINNKLYADEIDIVYGNDVTYDGTTYTLTDTITSELGWNADKATLATKYHYTCLTNGTTCNKVYYVVSFDSDYLYYLTLTNESDIEEVKEKMFTNTTDSIIKEYIEDWYETNLIQNTNKLEDSQFCYDRTFDSGALVGKDYNVNVQPRFNFFTDFQRTRKIYVPSLICANDNDVYTVSKGTLNYPIGLLSASEALLAGMKGTSGSSRGYLYTGQNYWLGSPGDYSERFSSVSLISSAGTVSSNTVSGSYGVRPVISLAPGVILADGDGTVASPYIVE